MKRKKYITLVMIFIVSAPLSALAIGSGYEIYDSTNMDVWVYVPRDFWYVPNGEGATMNPIVVKAEGHSYPDGIFKYVPSELEIHVWAHDREMDTYADWFELADYNVLTDTYGTDLNIEGHAGVGAQGEWGEDPQYTVGLNIGLSWSITGTEVYDEDFSQNRYVMALYQHLGSVIVDLWEDEGDAMSRFGVGLQIGIANSDGPYYEYHRYTFKVEVKLSWSRFWWIFLNEENAVSQTQTFYVGNGDPSTDTTIYLLPALDYGVSQS